MCGRYTLNKTPEQVKEYIPFVGKPELVQARFNIAPSQQAAVVVSGWELKTMRWGLVPSWAKDEQIGNRMINARSETVHTKPSFKRLLGRRRCLVLADGFFEWKKTANGKQPYYFRLKEDRAFAFAGLWDEWSGRPGEPLPTYTILTTGANECVRPVHHRMPVLLSRDQAKAWIEPAEQELPCVATLLQPFESDLMTAHPVASIVNSPRNDTPACIEPIEESESAGPENLTLF